MNHKKIVDGIKQKIGNSNSGFRLGRKTFFRGFLMYAAIFIAAIFIVGGTYCLLRSIDGVLTNVAVVERETSRGQRSEILLPDGSKVWLNAGSKISFFGGDTEKDRVVELEGEAFFDVAHSNQRPFIVAVSLLTVEVKGTSFNLKAYPSDKTFEATLVTGRLNVKKKSPDSSGIQQFDLKPGQQVSFCEADNRFALEEVDIEKYTSWKGGVLMFDNEAFQEVVRQLQRWYDVDIELQEGLGEKYSYTMTITEESIDEVLLLLKRSTPALSIAREQEKIVIQESAFKR